jgi:putative ABC transport system ATP-binding protein
MTLPLVLENVSHVAGDGAARHAVLATIDTRFDAGSFACLTGPSGAGKTTAMSILAGVVLPSSGVVRHGGLSISDLPDTARRRWRRRHVGLVFQTCRLFDILTADEHMALVARLRGIPAARDAGRRWLQRLGLGDRLHHRPGQLSGGEKQRVALAQALAASPSILLADEPTAALDAANAEIVACTLARYAHEAGAIVIAVSHDSVMFDAADRRIELEKPPGQKDPGGSFAFEPRGEIKKETHYD